jgi:putative GTP pyrophosphokinase
MEQLELHAKGRMDMDSSHTDSHNGIQGHVEEFRNMRQRLLLVEGSVAALLRLILAKDPHIEDVPFKGKPNVYNIESRVKDVDSFAEKLKRPGKSYKKPIQEITDLVGFRVIAFYTGDVDIISKIIEKEFDVDLANSGDTAERLQPDQFGYLSKHYVVQMRSDRLRLLEYEHCNNLRFEIQTRTILQHAWANLSHKLTYKVEQEAPTELRRQIALLSAALELADNESFRLQSLRQQIQQRYASALLQENMNLPLDVDSVVAYLEHSKQDEKWGSEAEAIGWNLETLDKNNPEHKERERRSRSSLVRILQIAGIKSIAELDKLVKTDTDRSRQYLKDLIRQVDIVSLPKYVTSHDVLRMIVIYYRSPPITSKHLSDLGYDAPIIGAYQSLCDLSNQEPG